MVRLCSVSQSLSASASEWLEGGVVSGLLCTSLVQVCGLLAQLVVAGQTFSVSSALFALAGVVVGSMGALPADALRERRTDRRGHQSRLRSTCADFASAIAKMKQAGYDLDVGGAPEEVKKRFDAAHSDARAAYERLRLTSNSVPAQGAARLATRYALGYWQTMSGFDPRPDEADRGPLAELQDQMDTLYIAVRRELDLKDPEALYSEPDGFQHPARPPTSRRSST